MKLSKSMSTLINVALVLLIAILAKALVTGPQHANAAQSASQIKEYVVDFIGERSIEKALGERSKEGMRFVTATSSVEPSVKILIFEK